MKRIKLILPLLIFYGCATRSIPPVFEDSNQHLIKKTINKINIGKILKTIVDSNSTIVFLPLEDYKPQHKPIISMIEDQVITSIYNNDFTVLERDQIAIKQLIREGEENYSITFENNGTQSQSIINTHLVSAEIAIFYRILELGIQYYEYPADKDYKKREALVSLHIRIQDSTNGKILFADNLTSKLSDIVQKKYINKLASFHYTFFSYEYPIQKEVK